LGVRRFFVMTVVLALLTAPPAPAVTPPAIDPAAVPPDTTGPDTPMPG
jgi:membrane-anchored mycosin MYCP